MKILITGFEPFGGEKINPALDAVRALPAKINGFDILKCEVPVIYEDGFLKVRACIEKEDPDAVILVGQAGGRAFITPETTAVNNKNARIPDNAGHQPANEPIMPGGPDLYHTTLPVEKMLEKLQDHALPVKLSDDAGTFVCNDLFYRVMNLLKDRSEIPAGFVHVPFSEDQIAGKSADIPFMTLSDITEGLYLIIETVGETLISR